MTTLIDISLLLAYVHVKDTNFVKANRLMQALARELRIVPQPVLTELFYLSVARLNYERAITIFEKVRNTFEIEPLTDSDMARMQAIMTQYKSAAFDFADVAIMVLAERLNITRICTFDRRDFAIFRPTHCAYFDLLP